MKRLLFVAPLVFMFSWSCFAQTSVDDSPATKEDVQKYLEVVHSRDLMRKTGAAMAQGMHPMLHEQYLKHKDELPPDYEQKMTVRMDEMLGNMPWDDMMQAMVPVYQKHFSKGDLDNLVAFYTSPTGAKLLRDMPSIMAEAMQNMMPIMTKYKETVQQRLQQETDAMIGQSKNRANGNPPLNNN